LTDISTPRFPYEDKNPDEYKRIKDDLWTLLWEDEDGTYPIGYMLDRVFRQLVKTPVSIKGEMDLNPSARTIMLFQYMSTEEERTKHVAKLTSYWRENGTFPILRKWRDELWPVYSRKGELLFSVERVALGLFGTMMYGVHMVAYAKDDTATHGVKLWVARRAATKPTFPSMLDNTAAGGLCTGEEPRECVVREANEEADLDEDFVRKEAECVGTVTYVYITDEKGIGEGGFIQPECQWVYELELPSNVVPRPKDGEVSGFMLCDVDEVKAQLARGEYKPNCALCIINFFVRRGILTEDNEPDLDEIVRKMHREISLPGPHRADWAGQPPQA
jgi:8-oxo-dGTP pyrophosphatase MutT (NUDIX family)